MQFSLPSLQRSLLAGFFFCLLAACSLLHTSCAPLYEQISTKVESGTLRVTVDNNKPFATAKVQAVGIKVAIQTSSDSMKGHIEFRRASLFYNLDPAEKTPEFTAASELQIPNLRLPLSFEKCGSASFSGSRACDPDKQTCNCVFDSGDKRTLTMEISSTIKGLSNQDWQSPCDNARSASLLVFVGFQGSTIQPGKNSGPLENVWSVFVRETDTIQGEPSTSFKLECTIIPVKTP